MAEKKYPIDLTDEEILETIRSSSMALERNQYNANSVLRFGPLIQLGLGELDRRRQSAESKLNREAAQQQLALGQQALQVGNQTMAIGGQQLSIGMRSYQIAVVSAFFGCVSLLLSAMAIWYSFESDRSNITDDLALSTLQQVHSKLFEMQGSITGGSNDQEIILTRIEKRLTDGVVVRIEQPSAGHPLPTRETKK